MGPQRPDELELGQVRLAMAKVRYFSFLSID